MLAHARTHARTHARSWDQNQLRNQVVYHRGWLLHVNFAVGFQKRVFCRHVVINWDQNHPSMTTYLKRTFFCKPTATLIMEEPPPVRQHNHTCKAALCKKQHCLELSLPVISVNDAWSGKCLLLNKSNTPPVTKKCCTWCFWLTCLLKLLSQ